MTRSFARRLAKLEAERKPLVRIPHVLHVDRTETAAEVLERFVAQHPHLPHGHSLIVVPARDLTPEDDAAFDAAFHAQQTKLIADARSARMKEAGT